MRGWPGGRAEVGPCETATIALLPAQEEPTMGSDIVAGASGTLTRLPAQSLELGLPLQGLPHLGGPSLELLLVEHGRWLRASSRASSPGAVVSPQLVHEALRVVLGRP